MRTSAPLRPVLSLALLAGLTMSGCRTVALQPLEVSDEAVVLAIPVVPQDELYECGLASISALCEYYTQDIPTQNRNDLIATASREKGLQGMDLRTALEAAGFDVLVFPGTLDHEVSGLFHHVDRGRPLLVMISTEDQSNHYCLFRGYDPEHDNVFLLDPRRGNLVLPRSFFDSLWQRTGSFTLLAMPHPTEVIPATPLEKS